MIRLLLIFFLLLASAWLGTQLSHDPGYFLVSINQWTIESTLLVGLVSIMFLFMILQVLVHILSWLFHTPRAWRRWSRQHRRKKALSKTYKGLIEFSEGHWLRAKKHLIKALPDSETPLLNYLIAAQAAQEIGDHTLRDKLLSQAQQSIPRAKAAVGLTRAKLQMDGQQWGQALVSLKHLQMSTPNHPYVLKLLARLYEETQDWSELIALLPDLKRNGVVSNQTYTELQQKAYLRAMAELIKQDRRVALKNTYENLPKNLRYDVKLNGQYCSYLLRIKAYKEAEYILRLNLRKQFNETLITLYGRITADYAQLNFAESMLKEHPHSSSLFLCLGRLSQTKQFWGKAKIYFEDSIKRVPTPEAYAELGRLLQHLSDEAGAAEAFKRGLFLVTNLDDNL